jgi:50S ribosomal subunit-associated GTPase HflX
MSLIDRVAAGLETLGKKANQALDEGKLRVELARVRRRMDGAARDLGYLTYRQAKGTPPAPGDVESLTRRIAEAETAAARIEADIEQVKQRGKGAAATASAADAGPAKRENEPAATDAASPSSPSEPPPGT